MGVTLANLQKLGTIPVDKLKFIICVNGSMIIGIVDLKIFNGISSKTDLSLGNLSK